MENAMEKVNVNDKKGWFDINNFMSSYILYGNIWNGEILSLNHVYIGFVTLTFTLGSLNDERRYFYKDSM